MESYIIWTLVWIILFSSTAVFGKCSYGCQAIKAILKCDGTIPSDACITPFINEVIVFKAPFPRRFNFTGKGWRNIKSLSLNLEPYEKDNFRDINASEFVGLDNLEKLQISCRCLRSVNTGAFGGLNNLRVLDFSNNEHLYPDLHKGFMSANLTNLSELYISNSSRFVDKPILEPDFFRIIKRFPLKVFDISDTKAWSNFVDENVQDAFPYLEKLNLSNSRRLVSAMVTAFSPNAKSCKRLRSLDLSYTYFDIIDTLKGNVYVKFELTELYIKNIFKHPRNISRVTANLTQACLLFQSNKSICLIGEAGSLKKLVLSENSLINLDPNTWNSFPNLEYLDFSSNLLRDVITGGYIHSLSEKLLKLETLILSNNTITTIPRHSFLTSTNLRHLDLSYNNLESVTFDTYKLTSLKVLDLRFNKITFLDAPSIRKLSDFLNLNVSRHGNETKELKLTGNPFSCTCEHVRGLQWLAQLNQGLVCKLPYKGHIIDDRLIKQVQYDCKLPIATAVYSSYGLVVIILFGVSMCYLGREYKRVAYRRKIEEVIRQFDERQNKNAFPVFLSYCDEDDEIVMNTIYPNLEGGLQKILKTDSPCVAIRDTAFRPGHSIVEETTRCVEASSVVVFFLTNRFCRTPLCRNETLVAHYEKKSIILMLWEKIDLKLLPPFLYTHYKIHARVHWVLDEYGRRKMRPGWDELCDVIVSRFAENTNVQND